jgi:hypothetical protein
LSQGVIKFNGDNFNNYHGSDGDDHGLLVVIMVMIMVVPSTDDGDDFIGGDYGNDHNGIGDEINWTFYKISAI